MFKILCRHRRRFTSTSTQLSGKTSLCLVPDSHLMVWRGWWWSQRQRGCQASDRRSSLRFSICRCETTGYFRQETMAFKHLHAWHQGIFLMWPRVISICIRGNQIRPFKPNHDVFLTLTKWFLCLSLVELKHSDVTKEKFEKFELFCGFAEMFLYSGIWVATAAEVYLNTNTKQQTRCLHLVSGFWLVTASESSKHWSMWHFLLLLLTEVPLVIDFQFRPKILNNLLLTF